MSVNPICFERFIGLFDFRFSISGYGFQSPNRRVNSPTIQRRGEDGLRMKRTDGEQRKIA